MSDIDKRVVQFDFDNRKFERNVKQSKKSLEELKESLNFERVSKSLDKVSVRFGVFEVAAVTALSNITNRVVDLGINLVKSLSVDNISAGWVKFGDKTVSVATMMSQSIKIAGREIENTSEKFEIINEQLDKLNWFTDETSYNFTDMVDSIGKFTAAGQDLDASVEAMMGIANWAALSGQNASTASRAMYQLAQAMGKGYVQLIDYKSIQNANMDTQEFRQTILDTAVAMGELTKQGDNYITKTGSKFTKNQFAEQLSSKWLTSGVLTKSLGKYSAAVDKLYEITQKEGITASEAIKKYSSELDVFGLKAFKAAQEARTFADVISSVKDAVSTGWMTTAENIFGNYLESKELWTDLANELYDVFAEGGNFRNEVLSLWRDLGGYADLFKHGDDDQGAFWNIYDSVIAVRDIIKDSINTIFPTSIFSGESDRIQDFGAKLKSFTENLKGITSQMLANVRNSERFGNVLQGILSIFRFIGKTVYAIRYALDPLFTVIKDVANELFTAASNLGLTLSTSDKLSNRILNFATKINNALTKVVTFLNPGGIIRKGLDIIWNIVSAIGDAFDHLVSGGISFENVINSTKKALSKFVNVISSLFNKAKDLAGSSGSGNGEGFFSRILAIFSFTKQDINFMAIGQSLLSLAATILNSFKMILDVINAAIKGITEAIKQMLNLIDESILNRLYDIIATLGQIIPKVLDLLLTVIEFIVNTINDAIDWFNNLSTGGKIFLAVLSVLSILIYKMTTKTRAILNFANGLYKAARAYARAQVIESIASILQSTAMLIAAVIGGIALVSYLPEDRIGFSFGAMIAILSVILGSVIAIVALTRKIQTVAYKRVIETIDSPLYGVSAIIRNITFAILSIAVAMTVMSKMEPDQIKYATISLVAMIGSIMAVLTLVSVMMKRLKGQKSDAVATRFKEIQKTIKILAESFLTISVSLGVMVFFAKQAGKLTDDAIKKTSALLIGMAAIIAGLAFLSKKADAKEIKKTVILMSVVALTLRYLIKVAKLLEDFKDWQPFAKLGALAAGLTVVAGAMVGISKAAKQISASSIIKLTTLLVDIMGAIELMVLIVHQLEDVEGWEALGKLGALAGGLTAVAVVLAVLSKYAGQILVLSAAFLVMATAVTVLAIGVSLLVSTLTGAAVTISSSFDDIFEFFAATGERIGSFFSGIWDTVSTFFSGIWDTVSTFFSGIWDKVVEWFDSLWTKISGWFTGIWTKLSTWFSDLWTNFKKGLNETWEKITGWFSEKWNGLIQFFTGKNKDGEKIGNNLVEGIGAGIGNAWNTAKDAVINAGKGVIGWFQQIFDIDSPSKVTEEMGRYLDEGLANGIVKNADNLTKEATDSMSKVISAIGDTIDNGINEDDLTITPVLDLSNVQAGTRNISSMMNSISGRSISMSGALASSASSEIARNRAARLAAQNQNGNVTNNNQTDTYNVTFNITTDDPEELARETDKILQRRRLNLNLAKGGV